MKIQNVQQNNTNFQRFGHKLVRMQKIQEGEKIAQEILCAREGKMKIMSGGGGIYGKVTAE